MCGAFATRPPSGPNKAQEKSRRSYRQSEGIKINIFQNSCFSLTDLDVGRDGSPL